MNVNLAKERKMDVTEKNELLNLLESHRKQLEVVKEAKEHLETVDQHKKIITDKLICLIKEAGVSEKGLLYDGHFYRLNLNFAAGDNELVIEKFEGMLLM